MPATTPRQFWLTPAELARLDNLGCRWGPVVPLTRTEVIRELIRQAAIDVIPETPQNRRAKGE